MPEICFSSRVCKASEVVGNEPQLIEVFRRANGLQPDDLLAPCRAYTLDVDDPIARILVGQFNAMPQQDRKLISWCAATFGEDVYGIASFCQANLSKEAVNHVGGIVGGASAAAKARLSGFQRALLEYQEALLDLQQRKQISVKGAPITAFGAERRVREAYLALEGRFAAELSLYVSHSNHAKNKGTALSNANRGILLANRSAGGKADSRLFVSDSIEAGRIRWFARFFKELGRGATVLDGFLRYGEVRTVHANGHDWVRESVKQTAGMGFAMVAGGAAGDAVISHGNRLGGRLLISAGQRFGGQLAIRAGIATSAGLVSAGPVGWAVLGVVVLAGVFVGMKVGSSADDFGQAAVDKLYGRVF